MSFWKDLRQRVGYLTNRARFHRELDEEIQFHLDVRAAELEGAGLTPKEAQATAYREFGARTRSREDSRAVWKIRWMEDLATDLRHAGRMLRRSPSFTVTALACLALGIGANVLIFSLVNAILLHSLPYPNADRIVSVRFTPPNQPTQKLGTNPGSYFFIRENSDVFEKMGAVRITGFSVAADSSGDVPREYVMAGWASPGLTDVMGVNPLMGRWFALSDDDFNVVISYRLWQQMFAGTPDVLGKKMRVDAAVATVVGVAPQGFQTLNPGLDFWRLQPDQNLRNALRSPNRVFNLFARLKPGVTVEQAQAQLNALTAPLGQQFEMNRGWGIKIDTLRDTYVGHLRRPLLLFQGAVFFLLLIACANVAALLMAQATTRAKELTVKAALGCSRGRVVRQLLTESVLLSILGGGLGIALAWGGLHVITAELPALIPEFTQVALSSTVLGFSLLLSLGTGVIFGGLPALQISRADLIGALRESGRGATASGGRQKLHGAFVVVQVALAMVLLAGAGLMVNSLMRLNLVQPGLDPHGLITFQTPFPRTLYTGAGNTPAGGLQVEYSPKLNQLGEEMRARLAAVPGVESAALTVTPPMGGVPHRFNFTRDGQPLAASEKEGWSAEWYPVSPGYFHTLRAPVVRGREFTEADSETGRPVVVVNATMAQRFFPNEDAIGRHIQSSLLYDPPREIVGIVGDVRQNRFGYDPQAQMYVPRAQLPAKVDMTLSLDVLVATFVVRSERNPAVVVPALRKAVADVSATQTVMNVLTVEQYAAGQLDDLRHYATLLSIFGGISVLLSVVGLSGIMVHGVSQRTNEIGIRVALGANAWTVLALIARQGLTLVGIGIVAGIGASVVLTRVIAGFLWGVTTTDPLTFSVAVVAMCIVALAACCVPARRALRIDPVVALRAE